MRSQEDAEGRPRILNYGQVEADPSSPMQPKAEWERMKWTRHGTRSPWAHKPMRRARRIVQGWAGLCMTLTGCQSQLFSPESRKTTMIGTAGRDHSTFHPLFFSIPRVIGGITCGVVKHGEDGVRLDADQEALEWSASLARSQQDRRHRETHVGQEAFRWPVCGGLGVWGTTWGHEFPCSSSNLDGSPAPAGLKNDPLVQLVVQTRIKGSASLGLERT